MLRVGKESHGKYQLKTKNAFCFLVAAVTLLFEVLACSAQTGAYLFTGSETNITLEPGTYNITAYGAQGGSSGGYSGGLGAEMEAQFTFTNPTTLTLLVGGTRAGGSGGGGGGGGSFVVKGTTPLVVAGGGGGTGNGDNGGNGGTGSSGGAGHGFAGGAGGSGGNGGFGVNNSGGAGGGGYSGNGVSYGGYFTGGGGSSFLNGGGGGSSWGENGPGGYGGGGGAGSGGGGGGGGYSGGGGGTLGGGGGGSIIDSSAITILAGISGVSSPDGFPNGEIIITLPPTFIEQPSVTAVFTSNVTFQAAVQGAAPLSFQWYLNGTPLSDNGHYIGSMGTNLTIIDFEPGDIGNYTLVVTNYAGSITSAVATINILNPIITSQPQSQSAIGGDTVTFNISATGQQPFSYQWEFDGTNIIGATNGILTLNNVQMDQAGPYDVLVSNTYSGVTSSNAILMVVPSTVTIQPTNQSAQERTTVSFNAMVSGQGPFSYQWQFGTTNLANATNGTLTLTDLQLGQSGAYTVVVSNSFGVVTSGSAELTVIPWPMIQPPSQTNLIGTTASFSAIYDGGTPLSYQWYFDGTNLSDGGQYSGAATSLLSISNVQNYNIGSYQVVINDAGSMKTSSPAFLTVTNYSSVVRYVNQNNPNPAYPYVDWSTAATNIQQAIDAAFSGDRVVVSNGVYASGAVAIYGMSNRLAVTKPLTVVSVSGPNVTIVQGYQVPGGTNGAAAIRCVYLTNGAVLSGFTLTSGATQTSGDLYNQQSGGGAWCESTNAVMTNCVISGNSAYYDGGGIFVGTLNNCTLTGNSAYVGGGAVVVTLNNCALTGNSANTGGAAYGCLASNCTLRGNSGSSGGGAFAGTYNNCTLTGNSASSYGGGAAQATLNNCLLATNSAVHGGGTYKATLYNCTLVGNSASTDGGGAYNGVLYNCTLTGNSANTNAGGAWLANFNNCVVYYNAAPQNTNYFLGRLNNCCTTPLPSVGSNNITVEPLFVNLAGGDYHLSFNSPCINSGNNAYVVSATDLDGNPRIVGGTVDIGAYEYQTPTSVISYAWLQQYGLPTDGSADYADPDGDGLNNYQEWIAGTNPTNALSVLAMLPPVPTDNPPGLVLGWQSVSNRTYFLQSSTNLAAQPAFSAIQSNIVGQVGTTSFTDTSATNAGPYYYRVGVQ